MLCETNPGPNPQNPAAISAATRDRTTYRDSTKYHAVAVRVGASATSTANATPGPNASVTGVSGMASPRTEVLAIMFTPCGMLICPSNSGLDRCVTERAACARTNWKKPWSWMLSCCRRWLGSSQSRPTR